MRGGTYCIGSVLATGAGLPWLYSTGMWVLSQLEDSVMQDGTSSSSGVHVLFTIAQNLLSYQGLAVVLQVAAEGLAAAPQEFPLPLFCR